MRRTISVLSGLGLASAGLLGIISGPAAAVELSTVSAGNATVVEGDSGTAVVNVPIDLSAPNPTATTTVKFAVVADTATGADFVARSGKLSFLPGVATKQLNIAVYGDTDPESDEHIRVVLSSPFNATLGDSPGGITIVDDDSDGVATAIEATVGEITVNEADSGNHYALIPLTLSRPAPSKIVVHINANCASATLGEDYAVLTAANVAFAAGQRTKSVKIQVLADTTPEAFRENIIQSIQVMSGPAIVGDSIGSSEILDDDGSSPPPAPPVWKGHIERVGVGDDEQEAESIASCSLGTIGGSAPSEISGDGRYTLFSSKSANLVIGDTNELSDVFVRDRLAQTTELVSIPAAGGQFFSTNLWAGGATPQGLSSDGRYVLFTSGAFSQDHLLVRDRVAGTTIDLGAGTAGSISDDGMRVVGTRYEYDPAQSAAITVLTLVDRGAGTTTEFARRSPEFVAPWQYNWGTPRISGNGRFVAFTDGSSTRVAGDSNGCADTFVYDVDGNSFERVSVTDAEQPQQTNGSVPGCSYGTPVISPDGRLVELQSAGWNLYPGATSSADLGGVNGAAPSPHVYLRDRIAGTTRLLDTEVPPNQGSYPLAISGNGRYAFYSCQCGEPLPAAPYITDSASIRRDLLTNETRAIGVADDGTWPVNEETGWWGGAGVSDVSYDGLVALFGSSATNLAVADLNGVGDSFVEDLR